VPERSDFLEGDVPAADKVAAFLTRALEATDGDAPAITAALVPWVCDALQSNHSVKAYCRDLTDFFRHMQAQGVTPLEVTADHVKLYKRALAEAGMTSASVARRPSVLRGAYEQLAAKGLISWETAQDIAAVKASSVQKNSTPSLTQRQAVALLEAITAETLQGPRDLAMMRVFFLTGCRVSAVVGACVGHLETDGVEHYALSGNVHNTLGVALHRARDYKQAIFELEKSMELGKGGSSFDFFFLAMAHWRLGNKDKARRWHDSAVQWMDKNQPKNDELIRFRTEAAELLNTGA
jgi:site-specific recombinase XerD